MKKIYSSINFINKPGLPLNTLIVSICLIGLFASCKKEAASPGFQSNNSSSILSIVNYCGGVFTNLDGDFRFESEVTNNDPAIDGIAQLYGFFYDKNSSVTNGGLVRIGDHNFLPGNTGQYGADSVGYRQGFYGAQLNLSLTTPDPVQIIQGSFYSPLPINITNVPPLASLTIKNGNSFEVRWNADPKNTKGVMLLVEYDSIIPATTASGMGSYTRLSNSIFVPDNGSYTLPWAFFSKFTPNKQFSLLAVRGNFIVITNGNKRYQVGGYSATAIANVKVIPN